MHLKSLPASGRRWETNPLGRKYSQRINY